MKIWILFLCAIVVGVTAQSDESVGDWDDDWKEYDDEWLRTKLQQLGIYNDEQNDIADSDKRVEEEIQQFREIEDDKEGEEKINDYQFEDNRSEESEEVGDDDKADPIRDDDDGNNQDVSHLENENDYDDYAMNIDDLDVNISDNDDSMQIPEPEFSKDDDDIAPLPSVESSEEIKRIMDEAQAIISEEEKKLNDFAKSDEIMQETSDELNKIVKETNAILEENLNPNDFAKDEEIQSHENLSNVSDESNEDIFADTNEKEDEEKISNLSQETIEQKDDNNANLIDTPIKDSDNFSDKAEDENDETVDKVYEDLNEDLDKLFETLDKLSESDHEEDEKLKPIDADYAVNSDESLDDKSDYENVFDSNLSDLFAKHSEAKDNEDIKNVNIEIEAKDIENDDEKIKDAQEPKQLEYIISKEVPYINDALLSGDNNNEKGMKSVNVDELSDKQLVQIMKDFEIQHSDVFNVESLSDDHVVNEITLEYGESKVIQSENYPAAYPTNRVVDWIVIGKGQGIELNVTDLAVNSAVGDYLMVKPGQADDSGAEGIIFSYHLNEPRAFRFMDVDRIFIRFDSKLGISWLRGFSLTVKVIAPPEEEPMPEPEPEPLLPEPRHTLTVMLGGLTLAEFEKISDQFRVLVADMATMYINTNGVDPGLNTTAEITQLISASFCNVQWPGFEQCASVRFSVPLVYEDGEDEHRLNDADLQAMWETYVDRDPFAARLRQMGIEEFAVPNDGGVLTVWLVVALGVLVSAAMLAFALWRYSCFEDYSRMPAHSDTDSLYEKRNSALYPTPHQMLPPLYAEKDYDSTRVDMGGFTNRSYTRTDMYDLDSEEEAVPRDRNAGIQPRDIFSV